MRVGGFLFLLAVLTGCGSQDLSLQGSQAHQPCPANVAVIGVHENFYVLLCGCVEPAGTVHEPGNALTCTVNNGTYVNFQFLGQDSPHQIVSTGAPSFPHSHVFDPKKNFYDRSYMRQFSTGNYTFRDAYQSDLTGTLVVL